MEKETYIDMKNRTLLIPIIIFAIGIIMMFFESLNSIGPFIIGAGLAMIVRKA